MLAGMAPTPQKDKPIRISGTSGEVDLLLRPEDLSWSTPSRMAATNTLGGAWIDSFGPGIGLLTIAGHTGWRGGSDGDWRARFAKLYDVAFAGWHKNTEGKADITPDALDFADSLDGLHAKIVPKEFTLRRNRSRPLLLQYNIQFFVISPLAEVK